MTYNNQNLQYLDHVLPNLDVNVWKFDRTTRPVISTFYHSVRIKRV